MPDALTNLYRQCGSGARQPSTESLQSTLFTILSGFRHAYLIVDALDECTERRELLDWIEEITLRRNGNVHLLVTSRQERDIEISLQSLGPSRICLEKESVGQDIATYLDWTLRDDQQWKSWNRNARIRDKVRTALLQGAQGMYGSAYVNPAYK